LCHAGSGRTDLRSPLFNRKQIITEVLNVEDVKTHNQLADFIKDFCDDLCSFELLLFFGRHPNARFNRTAVLRALAARRFDTAIALKRLTDRKLVITHFENGITLYALTKEEPAYSIVAELRNIDHLQWQTLAEQIITGRNTK
jgi:hypothetical protein